MKDSEQRTIDLAPSDAEFIDARVTSGAFASTSDVVSAGLAALREEDITLERWLQEAVAPAYDAVKATPSDVLTGDEVAARLRARHERRVDGDR